MKRIISILLIFMMLAPSALAQDAQMSAAQSEALTRMYAFNLMRAKKPSEVDYYETLSRAEAAQILSRFAGNEDDLFTYSGTIADVDADEEYGSGIYFALKYSLLYLDDENCFSPQTPITVDDFTAALMTLLGYKGQSASLAGILNGVETDDYRFLRRRTAAQILSNALDTKIATDDKLYRSAVLGIYQDKGRVNAVGDNSAILLGGVTKDEIMIDDEVYINSLCAVNAPVLPGQYVEFYYTQNGSEREIIYIRQRNSNALLIYADEIDETDDNSITYKEDKIARIAATASVVRNGRVIADFGADDLNIESGSMELYDTDSDRKYDVVNIVSYATFVVGQISASDFTLYDKVSGSTLTLDASDKSRTITITKDGEVIAFEKIKINDVLSVAADYETTQIIGGEKIVCVDDSKSERINAVVTSRSVRSALTEADEQYEYVSFESSAESYKTSKFFRKVHFGARDENVLIGNTVTALFDADGNVAYWENLSASSYDFGYLYAINLPDGKEGSEVRLKLYSQYGVLQNLRLAPKVFIDKTRFKSESPITIVNYLAQTASALKSNSSSATANAVQNCKYSQPILFGVNDAGMIDYIDTAFMSSKENEDNLSADVAYTSAHYITTGGGTFEGKFNPDTGTVIMLVPYDRFDVDTYSIKSKSSYLENDYDYNVEAFNLSEGGVAKIVVSYVAASSESIKSISKPAVITKVSQRYDNDRGVVNALTLLYDGALSTYNLSENIDITNVPFEWSVEGEHIDTKTAPYYPGAEYGELKAGDVIRFAKDDDGFITKVMLSWKADMTSSPNVGRTYNNGIGKYAYDREYVLYYGTVYGKDISAMRIVTDITDGSTPIDTSECVTFAISNDARFVTVEKSAKSYKVEKSTVNDIRAYLDTYSNASRVLVVTSTSNLRLVVIYK